MSNSIAVYLDRKHLPDGAWLGNAVRGMKPGFAFAEGFDPCEDEGWCPCRIGTSECGFEWELSPPEALPPELEGRRFDRVALLSWRSSTADATCAVLVAANVAHICGGVLEDVDGTTYESDEVLEWASGALAGLVPKARPRKKKIDPSEQVGIWMAALKGTQLQALTQPMAGDTTAILSFANGVRLIGQRWTFSGEGEAGVSTHGYPPRGLDRSIDLMRVALRREPIEDARFDPVTLELRILWPKASFVMHPLAQRYANPRELALRSIDQWRLIDKDDHISPDVDEARLVRR